jgi:beta-lactam-binding protein with PASTA domain
MPQLVGLPLSQAQTMLQTADLQTPQIVQAAGSAGGGEFVVTQSPAAGDRVDQTTPISLTVGSAAAPSPSGAAPGN